MNFYEKLGILVLRLGIIALNSFVLFLILTALGLSFTVAGLIGCAAISWIITHTLWD